MSEETMDPAALAAQLRQPTGTDGAEVARRMNETNAGTNRKAIELLALAAGDRVLEAAGLRVRDVHRHHEIARSNTGQTMEKTMVLMRCARRGDSD